MQPATGNKQAACKGKQHAVAVTLCRLQTKTPGPMQAKHQLINAKMDV